MTPAETNCSSLFGDRQRAVDTTVEKKGCGCYSMDNRRACIVMVHNIKFSNSDGSHAFTTADYSSLRFSLIFQDFSFPTLTRFGELDETYASDNLYTMYH